MLEAHTPALRATSLVSVVAHHSIVSLSAFHGHSLDAALGVTLPTTPRRITQSEVSYLWNGPNAWLAISENPSLFAELTQKLGTSAALSDQSDGFLRLRLIGPHARAALAKLVPIDLHPSAFPPDAVALTLAAHIGVKIWQDDDGAFILACFRSMAGALHHALLEATAEFEDRG
jgi:sarcosine oxidase subunit gamma